MSFPEPRVIRVREFPGGLSPACVELHGMSARVSLRRHLRISAVRTGGSAPHPRAPSRGAERPDRPPPGRAASALRESFRAIAHTKSSVPECDRASRVPVAGASRSNGMKSEVRGSRRATNGARIPSPWRRPHRSKITDGDHLAPATLVRVTHVQHALGSIVRPIRARSLDRSAGIPLCDYASGKTSSLSGRIVRADRDKVNSPVGGCLCYGDSPD
jgi:hypothetical protein